MANTTTKGLNPVVAGIAGAAIGAAAVALSRKETRQQMGKTVKDLQDKGNKVYHDITKKTTEMAEQVKKQASGEGQKGSEGRQQSQGSSSQGQKNQES